MEIKFLTFVIVPFTDFYIARASNMVRTELLAASGCNKRRMQTSKQKFDF